MNPHCQLIQAGEIQAIVGDASRQGMGGTQYCGLWSLASQHWPFNAFGNSFAGLLPGEIRAKSPDLEIVDETTSALTRKADEAHPVDVRASYQVQPPCSVDHRLTFCDRRDVRTPGFPFREVSWCCYMNNPEDTRIHFLSGGQWHRYISPRHGVGANIAPAYLHDKELEVRPQVKGDPPFHWHRYERRFDEPFYYGRLGPMVMILVFGDAPWLRFFCSPSGGGSGILPGKTCPAWDFEWLIPDAAYQVNREFTLRVRLIYKKFISDEDVLAEYRLAREKLIDAPGNSPAP
ncbi:MAG: hypothetical protein HYU36_20610 [Planctomycetes bacterium]|nr:hypothetical protein [Planctomycetota bacterium]